MASDEYDPNTRTWYKKGEFGKAAPPVSKINPGGLGAAAAKRKAEREAKEKADAEAAKKTGKKVSFRRKVFTAMEDEENA